MRTEKENDVDDEDVALTDAYAKEQQANNDDEPNNWWINAMSMKNKMISQFSHLVRYANDNPFLIIIERNLESQIAIVNLLSRSKLKKSMQINHVSSFLEVYVACDKLITT